MYLYRAVLDVDGAGSLQSALGIYVCICISIYQSFTAVNVVHVCMACGGVIRQMIWNMESGGGDLIFFR